MKKLVLFLISAILLLGCTSGPQDTTQVVKALPQVQAFLNEHPNAQIKVVFQPKGSGNLTDIREKCGSQMQDADYWYGSVREGNIYIETWLDGSTQKPLCAYKSATSTPTPAESSIVTQQPAASSPAASVQAQTSVQVSSSSGLPFLMQTPAGWSFDDSGKFGTKGIWMGPREESFTVNINLMSEEVGSMTLDAYEELSLANAQKILTEYSLVAKTGVTVAGTAAKTYTQSFKQGTTVLKAKVVFFIIDGTAYSLTYTALPSSFAKYEPVFDDFIATVKLSSPQAISPLSEERSVVRDVDLPSTATSVPAPSTITATPTVSSAYVASGGEKVQADCVSLCREKKATGEDLSSGPCLSYVIAPGWVCDVAHSPRTAQDDVQLNQCPMNLPENPAQHFVEVDPDCKVITVV